MDDCNSVRGRPPAAAVAGFVARLLPLAQMACVVARLLPRLAPARGFEATIGRQASELPRHCASGYAIMPEQIQKLVLDSNSAAQKLCRTAAPSAGALAAGRKPCVSSAALR